MRIVAESVLRLPHHLFVAELAGVGATAQELPKSRDGSGELHILPQRSRHSGAHKNRLLHQSRPEPIRQLVANLQEAVFVRLATAARGGLSVLFGRSGVAAL